MLVLVGRSFDPQAYRLTRLEEARLLFEQMLGYANHLGLYAEQTGSSGETLGNFPQAFTHLALISAAFNLDRAVTSSSDSSLLTARSQAELAPRLQKPRA